MVEGIQSSHQVNSFPVQAAAGILPDQQMLLPPFCLLQGQSTKRPLSPLLFAVQRILAAMLLFLLVKTAKPTHNHRRTVQRNVTICPASAGSPSAELGMPSLTLALLLVTDHRWLMCPSFLSPFQRSLGFSPV